MVNDFDFNYLRVCWIINDQILCRPIMKCNQTSMASKHVFTLSSYEMQTFSFLFWHLCALVEHSHVLNSIIN